MNRRDFLRITGTSGIGLPLYSGAFLFENGFKAEYMRRKVKITDVKTTVIKGNFQWPIFKIETDQGIFGLGESCVGPEIPTLVQSIKHLIIGEDPLGIDYLWTRMMSSMSGYGGSAGSIVIAISGIELALWDLAGKILEVPSYKLLGGKFRDKVRVYCDSHGSEIPDPQRWKERALEVKEKKFDVYKFDIDSITKASPWSKNLSRTISVEELKKMVAVIEAVREVLPPPVDLAVDCHWAYDERDALRFAQAMEPFNLLWLEDPTPPENPEAMARVTAGTKTPICTGENLYTRHGFRPFIEGNACDIVQPDIARCGGLLESKRIAELADIYYMPFSGHNVCSPVGTIACAHVCTAIRDFLALEFHGVDVPWWEDVVVYGKPIIKDGYIILSDKPGFGIELNDEVCKTHIVEGVSYF